MPKEKKSHAKKISHKFFSPEVVKKSKVWTIDEVQRLLEMGQASLFSASSTQLDPLLPDKFFKEHGSSRWLLFVMITVKGCSTSPGITHYLGPDW